MEQKQLLVLNEGLVHEGPFSVTLQTIVSDSLLSTISSLPSTPNKGIEEILQIL